MTEILFALQTTTVYGSALLGTGFVFGVKHALDADHLAAVSTIVSERRSWLSSSLVGGLWGLGHSTSLLLAGIVVLLLKIPISERVESFLEFGVGVMLIGLGVNALVKIGRGGKLHLHQHQHGGHTHIHPHLHDKSSAVKHSAQEESHHGYRISKRPLWIGMVHGLAGSAALMLLVLSTIQSPLVGFLYILVFGIGSIGGMMLMSTLLSLPFHLTASRFVRWNLIARSLAGLFSVGFGLFMLWEKGKDLISVP
ncbi:MAG: urease accessory protein UreH [Acidobacteria bacterium]|nr:urease accessory protein UreH [Acidobacteriota bacterium]